jgi:hypothetical protein
MCLRFRGDASARLMRDRFSKSAGYTLEILKEPFAHCDLPSHTGVALVCYESQCSCR